MKKKFIKDIAEKLNQLACKECTRGWLNDHDKSTDPINDILNCFEKGFISNILRDRLIREVQEIKDEI